jgi:hypothetical protein
MAERTEQFLTQFNALEQFLREQTDSKRNVPFGRLITLAAEKRAEVRHFARDLQEWADLRNAVVHEHPKGRVIAEVTPDALTEFTAIVERITAPVMIYPHFQRDVRVFKETDPLTEAVEDLWREGYSQVIVRKARAMTLLSYAGITRWMGEAIQGTVIDLGHAAVGDALRFEEEGGIAFVRREATLYDARELFQTFPDRRKQRLRVVVITEHGDATEAPLGLITASDIVEAERR